MVERIAKASNVPQCASSSAGTSGYPRAAEGADLGASWIL